MLILGINTGCDEGKVLTELGASECKRDGSQPLVFAQNVKCQAYIYHAFMCASTKRTLLKGTLLLQCVHASINHL